MSRLLVYCDGKPLGLADAEKVVEIPAGAAITITEDCNHCDFIVRGAGGKKCSCGNPRVQASRPYVDNLGGKGRAVALDTRPEWCPL